MFVLPIAPYILTSATPPHIFTTAFTEYFQNSFWILVVVGISVVAVVGGGTVVVVY